MEQAVIWEKKQQQQKKNLFQEINIKHQHKLSLERKFTRLHSFLFPITTLRVNKHRAHTSFSLGLDRIRWIITTMHVRASSLSRRCSALKNPLLGLSGPKIKVFVPPFCCIREKKTILFHNMNNKGDERRVEWCQTGVDVVYIRDFVMSWDTVTQYIYLFPPLCYASARK